MVYIKRKKTKKKKDCEADLHVITSGYSYMHKHTKWKTYDKKENTIYINTWKLKKYIYKNR